MELKVWVDGIQRIVCGVTHATTCQDVVFALAHATSTTGRFTLIERWRSNERLLAPTQHPLKVLLKWGEHASDVQFILQRTALDCQTTTTTSKASPSAIQALANLPSPQQEQYQSAYLQHNQHHLQQPLQQQQQQQPSQNNVNNISVCHNDGQQQHYRQEQPSYPDNTMQGSPNHIIAKAQRCISPPFGHGGGGSGRDIRKSLTFSGGALGRSAAGSRDGGKWPRNRGPNESPSSGHQVGAAGGMDQLQQAPYARVPSVASSSFPSSTTATSFSPPPSCAEAVNMRLQSQHSREHSRDSTTTTTDGHALSPHHHPAVTRHSSQPPWPLHQHTDTQHLHEAHVTNAHNTYADQYHPSQQSSYDGANILPHNNAGNVANFAHQSPPLTDQQQQASTSLNAQPPSKGSPGVPYKLSSPPRVGCHPTFTRPAAPPPYELARGHPPPHLFSNGGSMRGRRQCYSPPTVNPYHIRQNSASNLQTRRVSSKEGLPPGPGGAAHSLSGQSDPLPSFTNTSPLRLSPARGQHTIGAGTGSAFTRTAPGFPLGFPPRTLPPYRPPPPPPSARLTAPVGSPVNYNKLIYNNTDNNYSNNTNNNREQIIYNTKSSMVNSPNKHLGNNPSIPCSVSSNGSNYPRLSESPSRRKNTSPEKNSRSNSRERLQQLPVNASRNACDQSVRNSSVSHIPMLSSSSGHPPKPLQSHTSAPNIAPFPKKVASLSPKGLCTPNSDFRIANSHSVTQSSNISSSSSIKTLTKFSKSLSAGTLDPQPRLRTNTDTLANLGPYHPPSSPSSAPSDGFTATDEIRVFGPQDSPSDSSTLTPRSMYTNNNNKNSSSNNNINNNDSNNSYSLSGEVNTSVPSDCPSTTVTDESIEILNSCIINRFDTKSNFTNLPDARSVSPASTNHQHTTICNGLTNNYVHNNSVVVAAAAAAGNSNSVTGDVVESDQCGVGVCSSPTSPLTKPFTAEAAAPSTVALSPRRNQTNKLSECLSSANGCLPSPGPHSAASGAHASCGVTVPLCHSDHTTPLATSGHEAAGNLSSFPANGHPPLENLSHPSIDASRRQVNGLLSSSDPNLLMGGDGGPANESRGTAMEEHAQLADALGQHVSRVPQGTAIMGRQVEHVVLDGIHRDLVNLVNLQRDKLTGQQVQLTKFEAEITYVEGRWREDQAKLSYANAEMERLSHLMQQLEREVSEDELRQQELDLSSAVKGEQRLREQLGSLQRQVQECDGRVLHLQHSIRSLEEELVSLRDSQQSLAEASSHVPDSTDDDNDAAELAKQLEAVESALAGKREQVEELKRAMMTENLEALSLTPPDARPPAPLSAAAAANTGGPAGSSRRMLGSPRMLETAVPTSKNPHGVWV